MAGAGFGEHPWLWDEMLGLLFVSAAAVGLYFHAERCWVELAKERFSFNKAKKKINTSAAFLKRLNRIILKIQSDDYQHSFSVCISCSLVITELESPILRWWGHSCEKMFEKPHKFRMQKKLL